MPRNPSLLGPSEELPERRSPGFNQPNGHNLSASNPSPPRKLTVIPGRAEAGRLQNAGTPAHLRQSVSPLASAAIQQKSSVLQGPEALHPQGDQRRHLPPLNSPHGVIRPSTMPPRANPGLGRQSNLGQQQSGPQLPPRPTGSQHPHFQPLQAPNSSLPRPPFQSSRMDSRPVQIGNSREVSQQAQIHPVTALNQSHNALGLPTGSSIESSLGQKSTPVRPPIQNGRASGVFADDPDDIDDCYPAFLDESAAPSNFNLQRQRTPPYGQHNAQPSNPAWNRTNQQADRPHAVAGPAGHSRNISASVSRAQPGNAPGTLPKMASRAVPASFNGPVGGNSGRFEKHSFSGGRSKAVGTAASLSDAANTSPRIAGRAVPASFQGPPGAKGKGLPKSGSSNQSTQSDSLQVNCLWVPTLQHIK